MAIELVPPEPLEVPEPVEPVKKDQAEEMVELEPEVAQRLDAKVAEFVDAVLSAEVNTEPFNERMTAIHNMGNAEIRQAASVSNRILDQPVRGLSEDSDISQALVSLRATVEELDPSQPAATKRKLLGIIPMGEKLTSYFQKYQSAQDHIDAVLNALYHGQDELHKDNATIEQEKRNMWEAMQRLQQYVYVSRKLDAALETRIAEIEAENPEKARLVKEDMLFYLRQKEQDLLTQLAVSIQGYLALDMVRKNNLELIKGVDRATTTTISALRTAVIVAQALNNQKLVLDQITALNTTTGNIIASTSEMLKGQSAEIQTQAASATVDMEKLQTAFNNVYEAMDMISEFKVQALDGMAQTVNTLSAEVEKASSYVDRVRSEQTLDVTDDMALPDEDEEDVVSI
ncbi:MAG: toxic anion resistance protein [Anaerolineales bacterium]